MTSDRYVVQADSAMAAVVKTTPHFWKTMGSDRTE